MKKFTEIEQFRHVIANVKRRWSYERKLPVLNYTGTVKLHGCNAGISRVNGKFKCQSRNGLIDVSSDLFGFAKFVEQIDHEKLHDLFNKISGNQNDSITIFGEWIGKGIQKAVAVSQIPTKQWVIFSVILNDEYVEFDKDLNIEDLNIFNIKRIPSYHIEIDFNEPKIATPLLQDKTLEVEAECPWGRQFGVFGTGEGIVWKCDEYPNEERFWFKIKGLKHKKDAHKKKDMIAVDPEKIANLEACVDAVLPQWRLEQGLDALKEKHLDIDMENLGVYLQWINKDVRKEEMDTITASGFEWKEIVKIINNRAKAFFLSTLKDTLGF